LETKLKETNMIYNEFLIKYTRIHVRPIIYKEKRKPHRFTEKFVLEEEMNLLYFFYEIQYVMIICTWPNPDWWWYMEWLCWKRKPIHFYRQLPQLNNRRQWFGKGLWIQVIHTKYTDRDRRRTNTLQPSLTWSFFLHPNVSQFPTWHTLTTESNFLNRKSVSQRYED
jgi:hypothetical protein